MTDCFYHYTDAQTALKILTNKELWLTHTSFLNDSQEGKDIRSYLDEELNNSEISSILNFIDRNYDSYTCSFSKNGDLLSQWRGYCLSDEGYAIGFKQPESFESLLGPERSNYFQGMEPSGGGPFIATWQTLEYEKCIYDVQEKKDICKGLADRMKNCYMKMPDNVKQFFSQEHTTGESKKSSYGYLKDGQVWLQYYNYFRCLFKDASFQEENEYRLIISFDEQYKQNPCYRVKNGIFIPYFKFCFSDDLFQEIVIRKTPHDELSCEGLSHYLKHNKGMTDKKIKDFIKKSKIPFRG